MYFFLIDLPKTDKFIEEEFANIIYSPRYKRKIISWFCGCMKVLKASSKNDTIICWFDFQAVLCFWLCRILFCKAHYMTAVYKNIFVKKNKIKCLSF